MPWEVDAKPPMRPWQPGRNPIDSTLKGRAFHGPSCVEAELEGKADDPLSLGQQLAEALSP